MIGILSDQVVTVDAGVLFAACCDVKFAASALLGGGRVWRHAALLVACGGVLEG